MALKRRSGILLHPTSLPGPFGSGDFGMNAYRFVDWLAMTRQSLWQMLPLNDIGPNSSPYMSPSAFAGNVLLIDLVQLKDMGLLLEEELVIHAAFEDSSVDYPAVTDFRMNRLRKAASRFFARTHTRYEAYIQFCEREKNWLKDYALFQALDFFHSGNNKGWQNWPAPLRKREASELEKAEQKHVTEVNFWKFCQWCFDEQWVKLKSYANYYGIEIIGDVPIFVALNSVDVWAHPELFQLDSQSRPTVVAGVPPDGFSETGQRWGNPLYDWKAHAASDYDWWVRRMERMRDLYDEVRIDHFRGFEAYWEIPASSETALGGQWVYGPGADFFVTLEKKLGYLRCIAEDLGVITSEVIALRQQFKLPGMRILQFAFDRDSRNLYLPHNCQPDSVIYTGTHDNNTTQGWWHELPEHDRDYVRRYFGVSGEWIHWDLIRAAFLSVAAYAIIPLQDILGLDATHRMNKPDGMGVSWKWRFSWEQVEDWYAHFLAELTQLYGRVYPPEKEQKEKLQIST